MDTSTSPLSASFRDPGGCLVPLDGRILRFVNPEGERDLMSWLASPVAQKLAERKALVGSRVLAAAETQEVLRSPRAADLYRGMGGSAIVEHERIPFPSFPYEWAPEMLHAAAELTIEMAIECLDAGFGLKDGTPYNVLFRGAEPVFIDALSFEKREPGDPTWLAYAQFVRTFLLPLAVNRRLGIPLDQLLATRRDGVEPEVVYRWLGLSGRLRSPFLSLVSIPNWLGGRTKQDDAGLYERKLDPNPEKARFILQSLLRGLRRQTRKLKPAEGQSSIWSDYMQPSQNNYSDRQFAQKQAFVRRALEEFSPRSVLDVGANTGHFSLLSAQHGARVVAIDYDPVVVGAIWREARKQQLDILPLVVNLARPTPAAGWRNAEFPSFLDRARGAFDATLFLAVIHHMLVTERVPLRDILAVMADLTTNLSIVEFIEPADSMFKRLTRGRDHLHAGLNAAVFEEACRPHFDIVRREPIEGAHRSLYLLKKKAS